MASPRDVAVLVGSLRKDSINRKVAAALLHSHRLRSSLKSSRFAVSRYITRTKMPNRLRSGPCSDSG